MQNQANKTLRTFQTADNAPMLPKSSDVGFDASYESKQLNAAIYCRLSKEDEDKMSSGDDSESIQNQKLLLMDYAMSQGWGVYKIYSDDDRKGFDRERPAFNGLIRDAKNGLFDIVLCKHQSRFTRDMELAERYLHGEFVEWGIRFVSVIDHVDTNVKGTKKARQINGLMNEWYSEDLSENIRAVFRKKMEAGQFLGPYACYGYAKDSADRHKLVIDEAAAEVVREIFKLYLCGNGCSRIAGILTERGVPTPSAYRRTGDASRSDTGGAWAANTVRKILRDKAYLGHMIQGKERKLSYKSKKVVTVPESGHVKVENTHEPIIDEKTFYVVNCLMDNKRAVHNPRYGSAAGGGHIFKGKLRCLDCGTNMHRGASSRDGKTYYMRCGLSKKKDPKTKAACCTPHGIRMSELNTEVEQRLREVMSAHTDGAGGQVKSHGSDIKSDIAAMWRELTAIRAEINTNNGYIAAAYKDKLNGLLDDGEFIGMKAAIRSEITRNKEREARLLNGLEALKRCAGAADITALIAKHSGFKELTHELVNDFINYIEIGERSPGGDRKIVIHWLY